MNDLASIQDYVNKVQELYSETYFERRMNSQGDNENQNESLLMFEQINQDHSIIESLVEMCGFLIGQMHAKNEEQAELNDYQDRIKKQFEEELRNEIEEAQQYKNLYQEKCQQVEEQLEAIQDLEQQVQILQNQNTILENQAYQQERHSIDENVTHLIKQQESQIHKAQLYTQELQANNKKLKQDVLEMQQQISILQTQREDQKKQLKNLKNELSQIKLIRQQQDGLITSLESDLKIHNGLITDQEAQIDSLKEQLRWIHNQQFLQAEKQEQEKSMQSSSINAILLEKNTRSDSIVNNQQHNLKVQIPLLSYRQCLYKYRISEVSERYEQSASHSKHETAVPEKYADVVPFEISNMDESIKDKRLSFQQDADFSSKYIQQNMPQTARIGLGKQVVPKLSITDINNRITVVKKKKNCESSQISQSIDFQEKSQLFKEQSKPNPYQIFFELLVQCAKLNSEFFDEIYNIDTSQNTLFQMVRMDLSSIDSKFIINMNQLLYFNDIEEMQEFARKQHLSLFVYKKAIYDLSDFINKHPGGELEILQFENQDVSQILFNKMLHKHNNHIITTLQNYLFGYIEKQNKPIIKMKSSQLIIEKTRKLLQDSTVPSQFEEIPEDCSIEEMPTLQTNKKMFHSQKTIQLQK